MKTIITSLCAMALLVTCAEAQQADSTEIGIGPCYHWQPGDPSPIQAWVHYFVSRPDSLFTEEAVEEAVGEAMRHSGLPPDIVMGRAPASLEVRHLQIQAQRYERFALRLELAYVEPMGDDTFRILCHKESSGGYGDALPALLTLSHSVRDLLECVREKVELGWPEGTEVRCTPGWK